MGWDSEMDETPAWLVKNLRLDGACDHTRMCRVDLVSGLDFGSPSSRP